MLHDYRKGFKKMKILIMSDSHGRRDLVLKCIEQHPDNVKGNCDYGSDVPAELLVTLQGTEILLTHGHAHGINYGINALLAYSRKIGAKIALFGHTHVPYNQYHDGIYMLNPGSIAFPRDCSRPSYGLIDITPKGIITNTANFNQFKK